MALLTPLPLTEARVVLAGYGLEPAHFTALSAGSVNSNFLFETADGRGFFARIYEEQEQAGALFELELNEALGRAGVPVAAPVRRLDGQLVSRAAGKPFGVYERAAGEVLCQKLVTPGVARRLGEALAAVHLAELGSLVVPPGRFDAAGLSLRLAKIEASGRAELVSAAARVRALLKRLEAERNPELPRGLIHGDLFRDNALVIGDEIGALLDFESACQGNYAYDLMVTILAWCYGDTLSTELTSAVLEGYHERRPLSAAEQSALAQEGAFACARFATTRMTDFSLRVPEGTAPARDYGRFFQRLEELEGGVLEPLLARLS